MATGFGDDVEGFGTEFMGELSEFGGVETTEIFGVGYGVEKWGVWGGCLG